MRANAVLRALPLAVLGCAMSPRAAPMISGAEMQRQEQGARVPSARSSQPGALQVRESPASAELPGMAPAPAQAAPVEPTAAPVTRPQWRDGASGGLPVDHDAAGELSTLEARLGAAISLLHGDAATCRDLCGAASTICDAASEICRLTGDADRQTARDPRCHRARLACSDGGQRRDGACPTCPDQR